MYVLAAMQMWLQCFHFAGTWVWLRIICMQGNLMYQIWDLLEGILDNLPPYKGKKKHS